MNTFQFFNLTIVKIITSVFLCIAFMYSLTANARGPVTLSQSQINSFTPQERAKLQKIKVGTNSFLCPSYCETGCNQANIPGDCKFWVSTFICNVNAMNNFCPGTYYCATGSSNNPHPGRCDNDAEACMNQCHPDVGDVEACVQRKITCCAEHGMTWEVCQAKARE
jgi:hypothetical protein